MLGGCGDTTGPRLGAAWWPVPPEEGCGQHWDHLSSWSQLAPSQAVSNPGNLSPHAHTFSRLSFHFWERWGREKQAGCALLLKLHRKRSPASRGAVPQFPHMPRGDNPLATQDVGKALRDRLLRGFITRELEPWDTRLADNSSHPKAGV